LCILFSIEMEEVNGQRGKCNRDCKREKLLVLVSLHAGQCALFN
jgi:hypothetical protein